MFPSVSWAVTNGLASPRIAAANASASRAYRGLLASTLWVLDAVVAGGAEPLHRSCRVGVDCLTMNLALAIGGFHGTGTSINPLDPLIWAVLLA